jgi:steroid 5-alpha reductase family enzyme
MMMMISSGALIVGVVFFALWVLAVRQGNAGWVDVGWSFTVVLLTLWYAIWVDGFLWRRLFIAALAGFWGLRLAGHILTRLLREQGEDPRYQYLREHWGQRADRRFFFFFQAQGLANLFLTAPFILLMALPRNELTLFDLAGLGVILGAIAGETLADRQLAAWKADPGNRGKTCRKGLWAYSRHPNYFFEWLYWVGYPVLGFSLLGTPLAPWWPLTLLAPTVMLLLLVQFTGIPYTEKQALKSRGENYRAYQREVSPFIPWFPKSSSK